MQTDQAKRQGLGASQEWGGRKVVDEGERDKAVGFFFAQN